MSIVLPKQRLAPTRINPKIMLLYSLPKVGKTSSLALLDDCLILDLEGGSDMYNSLRTPINSIKDIDNLIAAIIEDGKANGGKYPYKYLAIDTADKLEDFCAISATAKYRKTSIGKNFDGDSVLELPKGLGYYYLREEMILQVERLARVCPFLIIISHVKDKLLIDKEGKETSSRDLSLAGKMGSIMCAKADAIGYMYREDDRLMINFETYEGAVMGSRFPHLAGKKFEFDWDKIYLTEEIIKVAV